VDAADTAHQLVTLSPSKKNSSLCDLRHDVRRLITRACFAFFFIEKMHACSVARPLAQHSSSCGAGQVVASIPDQSTHMDLWPVDMPMQVNGVFSGALKLCSYTTCMYVTEILCRYFY
jgi:hypothetical protein